MAAYAVIARIDRVKPHLAGRRVRRPGGLARRRGPRRSPRRSTSSAVRCVPLVAERWTALREAWAQTTFYLFDAEGWR